MNSRDAAFDESLKELIEATAAEAAAVDPPKPGVNGCTSGQSEVPDDESSGRKKRKRGEDELCVQPATPRSNYSSYCSAVFPRSVPDRRRARRMVLMQPPALCRKSYQRLRNAPQVENREIRAIGEVVHARRSLRTTMLSFPARVTKVCVRANGLPTHVTLTQGPDRASDRPKRAAAKLVLRQNARLHPLTRREVGLRTVRTSEITLGQEGRQAVLPRTLVHIAIPMRMQFPNNLSLRHGTCQTIWPTLNTCSQRTYRAPSKSAVWLLVLVAESLWRGQWRGGSRSSGRANA